MSPEVDRAVIDAWDDLERIARLTTWLGGRYPAKVDALRRRAVDRIDAAIARLPTPTPVPWPPLLDEPDAP